MSISVEQVKKSLDVVKMWVEGIILTSWKGCPPTTRLPDRLRTKKNLERCLETTN